MNASLTGLLDALRNDAAFASVADGTAEPAEDDIDASLIVGAPSGIRPALASAIASNGHTSQVVVIVSSSREAEETVNATYLSELYAASDDPKLAKRRGFIYSLVQGGWPVGGVGASPGLALGGVVMNECSGFPP